MDTTMEDALDRLPESLYLALETQCEGDFDRLVYKPPASWTVFNTVARADEVRRSKDAKPGSLKRLMEAPPAPREAPRAKPKRVVTPVKRKMRAASPADLRALAEVIRSNANEAIQPGTNVIQTSDREQRARDKADRMAWSEVEADAPAFNWGNVDLNDSAVRFAERFRSGLPTSISFGYLPDVLVLEMDLDIVETALRYPERVEVRPESFHKTKGYPILGFYKGDVSAILGLRDPHRPVIIAAYAHSRLDHDIHRVGHTGSGGKRAVDGLPRNPRQLVSRLRAIGCEVELDVREPQTTVTYKGQDLGKISTQENVPRPTVENDWQRMQRKVHAINQRAAAQVS